ncbi:arginase family protein [Actinoplanes sp. Pm04-4]|uniref:Arginase family protein n=1 Tax=Paractinoplanes pyxinae TaxID=2997416 RepID=A0ABT4B9A8_9ACTN|nr:arginase family protein [Actinoplanes pyxinae]MCY1143091.1 arginase family protein [Actinoplanes pyxinae]
MWFLLGAPWDSSGTGRGEARAPAALRRAGLSRLADVDLGDAATVITSTERDSATGVRALSDTVAAARTLAKALRDGMAEHPGHRPLVVGGDCSLLLGVFTHLRATIGDVGLWMFDGHPDYVDPLDSDTGETADSELAILTGNGPAVLTGVGPMAESRHASDDGPAALKGAAPMVASRHVALIGHRTADLDAESAAELARLPADVVTGADALTVDFGVPTWLHIDVDVLDPVVMPAVTYPQAGGPDFEQLAAMMAPLASSPSLVGVSVADYRPDLDPDGTCAARLVALLEAVL